MKNFSNKIVLLLFTTLTLFTLSGCGETITENNDGFPDTTTPIITLIGKSIVNVVQNTIYTDTGAKATDNVDGDITARIVKGGDTVDTSKVGKYTITYDVTDKAGNQAIQVKRIVTISEVCNPMTHNGTAGYCPITSPNTGRVWLDRNLGAAQVCERFDDEACYGDYYQWGRNFDGHQDSKSNIITTQATDINNAGNEFIRAKDWTSVDLNGSQRSANWSKIDGTSVCPIGYRVPTYDELVAEIPLSDNFLHLPYSGYRQPTDGEIVSKRGLLSSSGSSFPSFSASGMGSISGSRVIGVAVRCIKH